MKFFSISIALSIVIVSMSVCSSVSDGLSSSFSSAGTNVRPDGDSPGTSPKQSFPVEQGLRKRVGRNQNPGFANLKPDQDKRLIGRCDCIEMVDGTENNNFFSRLKADQDKAKMLTESRYVHYKDLVTYNHMKEQREANKIISCCRHSSDNKDNWCTFMTCFLVPLMTLCWYAGSDEPGCMGICYK